MRFRSMIWDAMPIALTQLALAPEGDNSAMQLPDVFRLQELTLFLFSFAVANRNGMKVAGQMQIAMICII